MHLVRVQFWIVDTRCHNAVCILSQTNKTKWGGGERVVFKLRVGEQDKITTGTRVRGLGQTFGCAFSHALCNFFPIAKAARLDLLQQLQLLV